MKNRTYSIIFRAVLFGIVLIAIGLLSALIAGKYAARIFPEAGGSIAFFLGLFVIWLVHGSILRSIYRLEGNAGFFQKVVAGVLAIAGGVGLASLVAKFIEAVANISFPSIPEVIEEQRWFYVFPIALILSLFSVVNIRVKSRLVGNLLELILIIATILFFGRYVK